jgi:CheY-like chemotaxis protein
VDAFRFVRLALANPDPSFCRTVSSALFPHGLRDISICHNGESLRQAAATTVDVIACDTDLPRLDFIAFVQDIRQGRVGTNPFAALIAITGDEAEARARGIARSGIDELVVKPINPLMLVVRIGRLSQDRQKFVMTPGYVGPSRRAARRNDGSDDNLVAVPNTLHAKMVERRGAQTVAAMVAAGRSSLDLEKAVNGHRVLCRMARHLVKLQDEGAPADSCRAVLFGLGRMASDVASRHTGLPTGAAAHVPAILDRVARLATRGQAAAEGPTRREVELAQQLCDAAISAVAPRTSAPDHTVSSAVPEIVAVVDGYLARS